MQIPTSHRILMINSSTLWWDDENPLVKISISTSSLPYLHNFEIIRHMKWSYHKQTIWNKFSHIFPFLSLFLSPFLPVELFNLLLCISFLPTLSFSFLPYLSHPHYLSLSIMHSLSFYLFLPHYQSLSILLSFSFLYHSLPLSFSLFLFLSASVSILFIFFTISYLTHNFKPSRPRAQQWSRRYFTVSLCEVLKAHTICSENKPGEKIKYEI